MRTFAQKQNQRQKAVSSSLTRPTVRRLLRTNAEGLKTGLAGTASFRSGHDFSRIPTHSPPAGVIQTKLAVNQPGDRYEQEAERLSEQVMRTPKPQLQRACHCGGECPKCQTAGAGRQRESLQTKRVRASDTGHLTAPPNVDEVLRSPGQPLDQATRDFMEHRFGHDFSRVRVHRGAAAEQSAQDMHARAYTVGHDVVFGAGRFSPGTHEGRRLIAHELTHVVQQSGAEGAHVSHGNEKYGPSPDTQPSAAKGGVVQRAPADEAKAVEAEADETEADYQRLVKEGKWCRDSEKSGELHPGLQCYREIPARRGYPAGNQVCFSKKTGQFVEESPDYISAVSGQKEDGTCDIPLGITDPPQPFTQRGRRALGHLIADIGTEDPDVIGRHFGRIAGVSMGIALPKDGLDPGMADVLIPAILGFVAGEIVSGGMPLLNRVAKKRGFLPTISLGAGSTGSNFGLGLGVGLEKRDRALPYVPLNTYLTAGLDSSLSFGGGSGTSSTFLAKVGVRIDPGKQGGLFALGSIGAGLAVGSDVSGATSKELGVGYRATDFLDVQVVRETVSGEDSGDATYMLTLKLVAPQSALKEHPKSKRK